MLNNYNVLVTVFVFDWLGWYLSRRYHLKLIKVNSLFHIFIDTPLTLDLNFADSSLSLFLNPTLAFLICILNLFGLY